jgi:pilus assembly protein CpaB
MASLAQTPARAVPRFRLSDRRPVLGVVVMLLAIAGSAVLWSSAGTQEVVVAARDVPAGAVLTPSDLTTDRLRLGEQEYAAAIPKSEVTSLMGRQLDEPIHANQILVRGQLSSRAPLPAGQVAMTIAVTPESAAGGAVGPGDWVEVLETVSKGQPDTRTSVVLPRAQVYAVGQDQPSTVVAGGSSSSSSGGSLKWVTLQITPDEASALAQAKWNADLDVVLLPPGQPEQPQP